MNDLSFFLFQKPEEVKHTKKSWENKQISRTECLFLLLFLVTHGDKTVMYSVFIHLTMFLSTLNVTHPS